MTYSLLFPIADIESGQELTRNYVEGLPANLSDDGLYRQCRLLPWQPVQLPPDISYEPQLVPLDYFRVSAGSRRDLLCKECHKGLNAFFFFVEQCAFRFSATDQCS